MSPFARGFLFGLAIPAAFAAGYLAKDPPTLPVLAAQTTSVSETKGASSVTAGLMKTTVGRPYPSPSAAKTIDKNPPTPKLPDPPTIDLAAAESPKTDLRLPPLPAAKDDTPNLNDPALQEIKRAMGIKTTILGAPEPVPAVLQGPKDSNEPPLASPPPPVFGEGFRVVDENSPQVCGCAHLLLRDSSACGHLNSTDVSVDFEVCKPAASKLRAVELWITRDAGVTWKKTVRQDGVRSPIRTRLDGEGEYGFRIVFETESGRRSGEPTTNAKPEVRALIDTTPPEVRLFDPKPVEKEPRKVLLHWLSADARIDDESTNFEFSVNGRDWQTITARGPINRKGRTLNCEWTLPSEMPTEVFLRVTVRDSANNVSTATTPAKVSIDLALPEGRITGVRETRGVLEVGPMPRVLGR